LGKTIPIFNKNPPRANLAASHIYHVRSGCLLPCHYEEYQAVEAPLHLETKKVTFACAVREATYIFKINILPKCNGSTYLMN
jgi:hypothetical protein